MSPHLHPSAVSLSLGPAVVWLKRDLRLQDHGAWCAAVATGRPVLAVFLIEPEVIHQPEFSPDQWEFQAGALRELQDAVRGRGGVLLIRIGEAVEQLERLQREIGFQQMFAHEETGTGVTYQRDRRVRRWARDQGVLFQELPQTGVVRRLASRNGWSREWTRRMDRAMVELPHDLRPNSSGPVAPDSLLTALRSLPSDPIPGSVELGLGPALQSGQPMGERAARQCLADFLGGRGEWYAGNISSPGVAVTYCSRLSAYLAFGLISMRAVWQAMEAKRREVMALPPRERGRWPASLRSVQARLHWHCHFMQKLEDEPQIEFENMHRGCNGLRNEAEADPVRLAAWKAGRTGHPLVDACLRSVCATGWLNFRMRALLVSYASYDLWLHWRHTAPWLARQFLDFEPGIHFSQFQMQSGTTGINTLRMYNPVKQAQDQDPDGEFIRRWVPELAAVPAPMLWTPWKMGQADQDQYGVRMVPGGAEFSTAVVAGTYPCPLVDHGEAVRSARAAFSALRRQPETRSEAKAVADKHGSRKTRRDPLSQEPVGQTRSPKSRARKMRGVGEGEQELPLFDLADGG
jgi:deoxyribodipyrimidine photo-lyase